MKISFVKAYDFPIGGASQNRLLGICRGLLEHGDEVEVHVIGPSKVGNPLNKTRFLLFKDLRVFNHAWRWRSEPRLNQLIGVAVGLSATFVSILKSNRDSHIDFIFVNADKIPYIAFFFLLSRLIGAKLGRDLNEYPKALLKKGSSDKSIGRRKLRTHYVWFDLFFVISQYLLDFYKPLARMKAQFLYLPVTVEIDRFPTAVEDLAGQTRITYCGDLSESKDGVITLIKAFGIIRSEFPHLTLHLLGSNKDKAYLSKLEELVLNLGLRDSVIMHGYVSPDKIPGYLYSSRLLVLSRPDNLQARGGFPTKLGEYLACGVPVVVTSVGEIPRYLSDSVNAFISEPGSASSFSESMRRALADADLSIQVGRMGRDTAVKYFSHSAQGKVVSEFLLRNLQLVG